VKLCTKCKVTQELQYFRIVLKTQTHFCWCRICENQKDRERYSKRREQMLKRKRDIYNPLKAKEKNQKFYKENRKEILEQKKEYNTINRIKIIKHKKEHYKENRIRLLESKKEYNCKNQEKIKIYRLKHYQENHERLLKNKRNYFLNNREKLNLKTKKYQKLNPEKINAIAALRRAEKAQATPKWLTKEHKKEMREIYFKAKIKTQETGIPHEVDHIIPIKGKTAIGLHVPWNLRVITKYENLRKGNKLI